MNIDWKGYPTATHYHQETDCYYFMKDGVWQLVYEDGDHNKSGSLYNGECNPEDLIAKYSGNDRGYVIHQMNKHFKRIGELLDYLDIKLPEHEAALNKAKEIV